MQSLKVYSRGIQLFNVNTTKYVYIGPMSMRNNKLTSDNLDFI